MPHAPETARPAIADPASVDAAIESRFSARAFLPRPVPQAMLQDILRVASRALRHQHPALEGVRAARRRA